LTQQSTPTRSYDSRIPLLVILPLVAMILVLFLGFNPAEHAETVDGGIEVPATVKTVRISGEVGNLAVLIGDAGRIGFTGKSLRVAATQELLAAALAVPFTLERDPEATTGELLALRLTPVPPGFRRISEQSVADGTAGDNAPLFRQIDLNVMVPVHLGVEIVGLRCNVRVDTRQAPTSLRVAAGDVLVMHTSAPLEIHNGGGPTIIDQHRGALDMEVNGKCRVSLAELVGPLRIVSAEGEVGLHLPRHASFTIDARSTVARVRNAFGLEGEQRGAEDYRLEGTVATGEHRIFVEAKQGPVTIDAQR
jgi:hypothetical protein